jgi:hypothetical protein
MQASLICQLIVLNVYRVEERVEEILKMSKRYWLTIAVFSLITFPVLAPNVGLNSLTQANAQGMPNRFSSEIPNNRPHFARSESRSHLEISNGELKERHMRLPFNKGDRLFRPFPFYGFYGGGGYGDDHYDGGDNKTVNIIIDNNKQYNAPAPTAKLGKPIASPHIVTLNQKHAMKTVRTDRVTEIRGTKVSTVSFPDG